MGERLFLEAELPFFMLDTQYYPTTVQGKLSDRFDRRKAFELFLGDSIAIARQLYNKYQPSLNEIYLPETNSQKKIPFHYHFNKIE